MQDSLSTQNRPHNVQSMQANLHSLEDVDEQGAVDEDGLSAHGGLEGLDVCSTTTPHQHTNASFQQGSATSQYTVRNCHRVLHTVSCNLL